MFLSERQIRLALSVVPAMARLHSSTCHPGLPPATRIGGFASDVFPTANR